MYINILQVRSLQCTIFLAFAFYTFYIVYIYNIQRTLFSIITLSSISVFLSKRQRRNYTHTIIYLYMIGESQNRGKCFLRDCHCNFNCNLEFKTGHVPYKNFIWSIIWKISSFSSLKSKYSDNFIHILSGKEMRKPLYRATKTESNFQKDKALKHRLIKITDRTLDVVFSRFMCIPFIFTLRQKPKGVARSRRRTGSLSV